MTKTLEEHLAEQKSMQEAYDRVFDRMSAARLAERRRLDEIEIYGGSNDDIN